MAMQLGHRLAPPRFVMFAAIMTIVFVTAVATRGPAAWSLGCMIAFDIASVAFLIAIIPILRRGGADQMRAASQANDANRAGLLIITVVTSIVVLVSVVMEVRDKHPLMIALVLATLILCWLFSNTIYALHYAHLYYLSADDGEDSGGIKFPDCDDPDYWDFLYFSLTLGMTFQTSDVDIPSRRIRRIVLGQCLAAFVFNLGILALTINTIGGLMNG